MKKSEIPTIERFKYSNGDFNKATEASVVKLEMMYNFFGHKRIVAQLMPQYWTLWNIFKGVTEELAYYWRRKIGKASADDLGVLQKKFKGPALIIGSGPSLEDVLPILHKWKGAIFCNSSQYATLQYYGVEPTWIDVVDPRIPPSEFMHKPPDYKKTSMIIQTGMFPPYVKHWKGKKYFFRIFEPSVDFYSKVLPMGYQQFVSTISWPFGCMSATALGHAYLMGYEPIIFVGTDMGYSDGLEGKTRFTDYTWERWKGWKKNEIGTVEEYIERVVKEGNWKERFYQTPEGVITDAVMLVYRGSILRVVCLDCSQVFDGSRGTLQLPKVDGRRVIETQGECCKPLFRTREQIRRDTQREMHKEGMYLLSVKTGGHKFVGMDNWRKELKGYIEMLASIDCEIDFDETWKYLEEVTEGIELKPPTHAFTLEELK